MSNIVKLNEVRANLLKIYPKTLPNSMKIVELVNSGTLESNKTVMQLMVNWKVGMSVSRPSFNTIKAYSDENERAKLIAAIHKKLWELVSWIKVDNKLTELECYELAVIILDKYRTMCLEDFLLFIKKGKAGEFGKVFNRFDSQVVLEWLEKHDAKIDEMRELNHRSNRNSINQDLMDVEIIKNSYDKLLKKEGNNLPKNKNPYTPEKEVRKGNDEDYRKFKADFIKKRQEIDRINQENQNNINKIIDNNKND